MQNLRKVSFITPSKHHYTLDGEIIPELTESGVEKTGFFHCFGNRPVLGDKVKEVNLMAIIEEEGTGKVYEISPESVTFETEVSRKVEFTLEQQKMNMGDYGYFVGEPDEKAEEILKKRIGYYLGLGNELYYNPDTRCQESKIVAVVEEEGTGQVYHVIPKFMRFQNTML